MSGIELYNKDTYINFDILNYKKNIYEYDIRSANVSVMRELQLIPSDELDYIASLPKQKRVAYMGDKYLRNNKDLNKRLLDGYKLFMKKLFIANDINNTDVVAIRRDAIFVKKELENTTFGSVEFVLKHKWTSHLKLKRMECFYNSENDEFQCSGIGERVKNELYTICEFIKMIMRRLEYEPNHMVLQHVTIYLSKYKRRELDIEFYRSFNSNAEFIDKHGNKFSEATYEMLYDLNIEMNYDNVFVPMITSLLDD